MSGSFHESRFHGNIRDQTQIDIRLQLDQHDKNIFEIKEMLIKYNKTQESKTYRSRSKYEESSHRTRSIQGEGTNIEPYKKSYSPCKEVFYNSYIVDQYSSSTYPRKDYKMEGYSSKPHNRRRLLKRYLLLNLLL